MEKMCLSNSSVYKEFEDKLYVDKTKYIYSLISDKRSKFWFLSRPRRFGKTLLVSTLESIFKGEKELFKGRYIYTTDYDWKEYPVIHLDFSGSAITDINDFKRQLCRALLRIARKYNIEYDKEDYSIPEDALLTLVEDLYEKYGPVVLLIDEYDSPLTSEISNPLIFDIRQILHGFYATVKKCDPYLHFVYITGVSKFSKMSVFSAMNKLVDISMDDKYSAMFGYTEEELHYYFEKYIDDTSKNMGLERDVFLKKLKDTYDGYKFSPNGENVYNPISLFSFFFQEDNERFGEFWVDTGSTKFVTDIAEKTNFNIATSFDEPISIDEISSFDITDLRLDRIDSKVAKLILLQSGYFSIKKYENGNLYLGFPNTEVASAFSDYLLRKFNVRMYGDMSTINLEKALEDNDYDRIHSYLVSFYANLPYDVAAVEEKKSEMFYQSMLYVLLYSAHIPFVLEDRTSSGRIDVSLEMNSSVYIIEMKKDKSADIAISQIKAKRYKDKFLTKNKKIVAIGMTFSDEKRNIVDWSVEDL